MEYLIMWLLMNATDGISIFVSVNGLVAFDQRSRKSYFQWIEIVEGTWPFQT